LLQGENLWALTDPYAVETGRAPKTHRLRSDPHPSRPARLRNQAKRRRPMRSQRRHLKQGEGGGSDATAVVKWWSSSGGKARRTAAKPFLGRPRNQARWRLLEEDGDPSRGNRYPASPRPALERSLPRCSWSRIPLRQTPQKSRANECAKRR